MITNPTKTISIFLLSSNLLGCSEIDKLKEDLGRITNQTVLSGLVIGSDDFEHPLIDMETGSYSINESRLFIASAGVDSTDLNPEPITGASVDLESNTNGTLGYTEDGDGFYGVNSDDGLEYVDNEMVSIVFTDEAGTHSISTTLPMSAEMDLDDEHAIGDEMVIDLTGQGFDSHIVVVTRFPDGEVVYSNEPTDFSGIYEMANSEGELTEVVIPGDAFSVEGIYAIGLSAMIATDSENMVELNTVLSSLLAGKVTYDVVCVPMCPPEIPE
jgi:hypothetical protein